MTPAQVLLGNWRALHTLPATGLYPHQWSWDSAFVAFGLRHLSPRRAQQELEALLSAQWADGRLPQIVFDPARDDDYSPGDAFWHSVQIPGSPPVPTSGLVQPPVHAWAALAVHLADPAESARRRFLERAYPALVAWHGYLRGRRDRGSGLLCLVHPWESGTDNSPLWDAPLAEVPVPDGPPPPRPDLQHADASERPSEREYALYLSIAARYRDGGCADDTDLPFLVEDPAATALQAVSELALARVAGLLGLPGDAHRERAAALTGALEQLWLPEVGCYTARDVRTGRLQPYATCSGLVPLLLPDLPRAPQLLDTLRGPRFALGQVQLVPSADLTSAGFDPARYWRGPSWFNTAWLVVQALRGRGLDDEAGHLARQVTGLAAEHGCPEYVDPLTGVPHGTLDFSWTAALALDLAADRPAALP